MIYKTPLRSCLKVIPITTRPREFFQALLIPPRCRLLTTVPLHMSVEFLTTSRSLKSQEAATSHSHATPIPSSTDTPYTYHFGSTQSESQSAPTGTSNPGLVLGVLAGLIVFFALLCTWCCKRRFSKKVPAKTQVAASYLLPQYSPGGYTYPQPPAPPPAVVHEQGPWPGYPVRYYSPTDRWAQPGVPSEGPFGPRQMSAIQGHGGCVPQRSAPAPQSLTPQSFSYSTPLTHSRTSSFRHSGKRLSVGSRFPIAPPSG